MVRGGVREVGRAQLQASGPGLPSPTGVAVDAHDRQQLAVVLVRNASRAALRLGDGERPLDQAVAFAAHDVENGAGG